MISTHVLDAMRGRPAVGMQVDVECKTDQGWDHVGSGITDADGRISELTEPITGIYRLTFQTATYLDVETFYPEVSITVRICDPDAHHHVPLLLSPFAYSTYRGS